MRYLILFFAPSLLFAADYFVSNTGDDGGTGLSGAPWETINKVNTSSFSAGDTISFNRGDTWAESIIPPSAGSSGNPITFQAYGSGALPKITGAANEHCVVIRNGDSYLTFKDLHLADCGGPVSDKGGVNAYGPTITDVILDGLTIEDATEWGVYAAGLTNFTVQNSSIFGSVSGDGILIDGTETGMNGGTITGNIIFNNNQYGIQVNSFAGNRMTGWEIYGNTLINNDVAGIGNFGMDSGNIHGNYIYGTTTGIENGCDSSDTGCAAGAIDADYVDNTIIVTGTSYAACFVNESANGAPTFDSFVSNICYHNNTAGEIFVHNESITGDVAEYNNFCAGASSGEGFYWDGSYYADFAAYKASSGQDANGFECTQATSGDSYYVSTTGSDSNPCSWGEPCLTIQEGVDQASAGDTVMVKAGTYIELVSFGASGTSGNLITLRSYPGDAVTIDADTISMTVFWEGIITVSAYDYIRVQGIKVMNSGYWGILVRNASYVDILDNETYDTYLSGIGANLSDNVLIDNNDVELAVNNGTQECITVSESSYVDVTNNHITNDGAGDNGGEGIDIKDGSSNVTVSGNYVHDLDEICIYVDAYDSNTSDIIIENNLVHDCTGYGIAIAGELGADLDNVTIRNNIAYDNQYFGIMVGDWDPGYSHPMSGIKIINNTLVDNGIGETWGGGIGILNSDITDAVIIRNNIASGNVYGQIVNEATGITITSSNNITYGTQDSGYEVSGTDDVDDDPDFVNETTHDFHLQTGSPAIGAATSTDAPSDDYDGNTRPCDTTYDIGAYEKCS